MFYLSVNHAVEVALATINNVRNLIEDFQILR